MAENKFLENSSWKTVIQHLCRNKLDCIVIGGAALALHGLPRMTLDIDIYLIPTPENFDKLFRLLCDDLKFTSKQEPLRQHSEKPELFTGQWLTFSNKDGIDLIDVFIAEPTDFTDLLSETETMDFYGDELKVLTLSGLKTMKQSCGRPVDLADVAMINEILED